MRDRRLLFIIVLGAGAYILVAQLIVSQRAPFSFTEIFDFLKQQYTSLYSLMFD